MLYDYYRVYIPSDYMCDAEERAQAAFTEAENMTRIWARPCDWTIISDDGECMTVRRRRNGLHGTYQKARALGLSVALAKRIAVVNAGHGATHKEIDAILESANSELSMFGVESIRSSKLWDRYYCDLALLYVNTGDTYNRTLVYDTDKSKFVVGSWGDLAEKRSDLI